MMDTELDLNTTSSTNLLLADDSLEEIYQFYNRKVYGYFRRNGFDHEAAEDLTQEVFCRLLRFKDTFESNDQIRNWIFKVARNLLIDVLRKKENGSAKPILMEDLPSFDTLIMDHIHVEGPEQTFVTEESNGEVMSLIEELSPRYADVIRLRELEGLKYQEIAKELGMTAKAVEGLLHRARAKLKSNYTAFRKNYHGLLVGLAFVPRLFKRGTATAARAAWKGIKLSFSKVASLGKSLGASSFLSGTGLMSGVLAVLLAGGITAGGIAMAKADPQVPHQVPMVALSEANGQVALAENLNEPVSATLPALDVNALPALTPTNVLNVPLIAEVLGVLDGQVPSIDLSGTVDTVISGVDSVLDQVYIVVDTLLSGTAGLVGNLLSLVGTVPGLSGVSGLAAGLVAGLSGASTEPLRELHDQLLAGVQSVADPVLEVVDTTLNQLVAPLQPAIEPIGAVTDGLTGGNSGGIISTVPVVTIPGPKLAAPETTETVAPLATEIVPDATPAPVAEPGAQDQGLLPSLLAPLVNGLLRL